MYTMHCPGLKPGAMQKKLIGLQPVNKHYEKDPTDRFIAEQPLCNRTE